MRKYLAILIMATLIPTVTTTTSYLLRQGSAFAFLSSPEFSQKAPIVTSGDNVYIVWSTDKGTPNANGELMFRSSSDNSGTFGDKINLSNTTGADSVDAEIAVEEDNVFISWWERNATANEPVLRISTDNGATFGTLLKLATNGTIGQPE